MMLQVLGVLKKNVFNREYEYQNDLDTYKELLLQNIPAMSLVLP